MSVTQKEIAQRLNCSQAHVARALSGRSTGRSAVSEETRLRIEAVAREMGYDLEANREARSMAGKRHLQRAKTELVAVAISSPDGVTPRHLPYYAPFLDGVEAEAAELEYDVCVIHKRYKEIPKLLRGQTLDGAIVSGFTLDQIPAMQNSGMKVVTYQTLCPGVPGITPDLREGTYLATRYLLELGHRKIAMASTLSYGDGAPVVAMRLNGYQQALAEYGVPFREEWVEAELYHPQVTATEYCTGCDICAACIGWDTLKAKSGTAPGARPPFTAVVCFNDPIAMGIIRHAEADGLVVPRDLSVTGFDNMSDQYRFSPSITSVSFSNYDVGREAMKLLFEAIQKEGDDIAEKHVLTPVTLVQGQSTARPPNTL